MVFASEDERLISRWAQAEATRAEQVLTKDTENLEVIAKTFISEIEMDVDTSQRMRNLGVSSASKYGRTRMAILAHWDGRFYRDLS